MNHTKLIVGALQYSIDISTLTAMSPRYSVMNSGNAAIAL